MNSYYVYLEKPIKRIKMEGIIYYQTRNQMWFWNRKYYDNHDMAIMLIDILYQRNLINEATYRKITNKNHLQNRIA